MAGYVGRHGRGGIAITRFTHRHGHLVEPSIEIQIPPKHQGIVVGSEEISKRYFEQHQDTRFKNYFHAFGETLGEALSHARGYIEACSDPLAAEIDPLCKGIGGHIHAAAVTPSGFQWLIEPKI
jgi:hypothetical protein